MSESPTPAPDPTSWIDAAVGPCDRAPRLAEGQPAEAVLWVTAGEVRIDGRRTIDAKKGALVAYHDDGSLRWTAATGTHVRWSARPIDARPGETRPWTPTLSRDLPVGPSRPKPGDPRRRALVATALWLASAWLVAWLVGCAP